MNRYEKYKDSGIAWIGEIPEGWSVRKGKRLFHKQAREVRSEDEIVTCFRDGQVTLRSNRRTDGFTTAMKEVGYQRILKGDLVIHNMDAFAGAIGVSDSDGKSTPVYSACTPISDNDANVYYYCYLLRSFALNGVILSLAKGIRERSTDFRFKDFGELTYHVPPTAEQEAIAEFLDVRCVEIDELVGLQEEMIKELQAYKQSVITETVTRGLNPDAPLRDSGIPWIGSIPAHWEVKRLKFAAKAHSDKLKENENLKYIGLENIVSCSAKYIETKSDYDKSQAITCKIGDVIFGKLRPYLAKVLLASEDVCCSSEFAVFSVVENANYFKFLLLSDWFVKIVDASTYGAKMPRANIDYINNMFVIAPSIEEQRAIADHLDRKCEEIDKLIKIKRVKIEQLKEYKKSTIFEYVTGKKRV